MHRTVSARLEANLSTPVDIVLAVAVHPALAPQQTLWVTLDGAPVDVRVLIDEHGGVLHCADRLGPGQLAVAYDAAVDGRAEPLPVRDIDSVRYLRPSRYCESDHLGPTAQAEFGGLSGV